MGCRWCAHWVGTWDSEEPGECRRFPQIAMTKATYQCGEFLQEKSPFNDTNNLIDHFRNASNDHWKLYNQERKLRIARDKQIKELKQKIKGVK